MKRALLRLDVRSHQWAPEATDLCAVIEAIIWIVSLVGVTLLRIPAPVQPAAPVMRSSLSAILFLR